MLSPGEKVERYEVLGVLGQGGMAVVYRVRHLELGTEHALKVPRASTPELRARLRREAALQAGLSHPNLVPVTDTPTVDGELSLLMPFVDGPTLAAVIERQEIPIEDVDAWFRGIVRAVAYVHARGIVHRDLKPQNVLLAREGAEWAPRVLDFGIGRVAVLGERAGTTVAGTPGYSAPEQLTPGAVADRRSDVYSLGVLLHVMLAGRLPGSEGLAALRPDAPPLLLDLVDRCLRPDPAARPQDAGELLVLLGEPRPADTRPGATTPPPAPPSRRPSWAWALVPVAVAVGWIAHRPSDDTLLRATQARDPGERLALLRAAASERPSALGESEAADLYAAGAAQLVYPVRDPLLLAAAPDGDTLAVADTDGRLVVLDTRTGQERWAVATAVGRPAELTWSPDGRTIAIVPDGANWRRDPRPAWTYSSTGQPLHSFAHAPATASLAWSPDSARVLTYGYDGSVTEWNARSGAPEWTIHGVAGSPVFVDEAHVLFAHEGVLEEHDGTGALVGTWGAPGEGPASLSRAGERVVLYQGTTARLVERGSMSPPWEARAFGLPTEAGRRLLFRGPGNDLTLRDPADPSHPTTLRGHDGRPWAALYRDGMALSAGLDGRLLRWSLEAGTLDAEVYRSASPLVSMVALSGDRVAVAEGGAVRVFAEAWGAGRVVAGPGTLGSLRMRSWATVRRDCAPFPGDAPPRDTRCEAGVGVADDVVVQETSGPVARLGPDGAVRWRRADRATQLVVAGDAVGVREDKVAALLDLGSGAERARAEVEGLLNVWVLDGGSTLGATTSASSVNGGDVFLVRADGQVRVTVGGAGAWGVYDGPDHSVVIATFDGRLVRADLHTGASLGEQQAHEGRVWSVAAGPGALVTAGADGRVIEWGASPRTITTGLPGVRSLLRDGDLLAAASGDGRVVVFGPDFAVRRAWAGLRVVPQSLALLGSRVQATTPDGRVLELDAAADDLLERTGRDTNLRVCHDGRVVPVVPWPSPSSVWADCD